MPKDRDGNKWACASCVRGHRTAKCAHHTERWLVKIKKPGRPQTKCRPPLQCHCPTEFVRMECVGEDEKGNMIVEKVQSWIDLPPEDGSASMSPPSPPSAPPPFYSSDKMSGLYMMTGAMPATAPNLLYPPMHIPDLSNQQGHIGFPMHDHDMHQVQGLHPHHPAYACNYYHSYGQPEGGQAFPQANLNDMDLNGPSDSWVGPLVEHEVNSLVGKIGNMQAADALIDPRSGEWVEYGISAPFNGVVTDPLVRQHE